MTAKKVCEDGARNKEQVFFCFIRISVVTITGMAGTGKTLLAMAAGLKLVADEAKFRRLVVSRPIFPLGRDIGFLLGDISAKLNPWMQPILTTSSSFWESVLTTVFPLLRVVHRARHHRGGAVDLYSRPFDCPSILYCGRSPKLDPT